jgi:hypothetical protein
MQENAIRRTITGSLERYFVCSFFDWPRLQPSVITMRSFIRGLTVLIIVAVFAAKSPAEIIGTLYNTGVSSAGTPLPDGTIGDPHYSLIVVPGGTSETRVRTSSGGFPIPPWVGDNTISAWIGPNNAADLDGPGGDYTYRTTFDLTGLIPGTASISGQWSTDNLGVDILINGVSTGQSITNPALFHQFSTFTVDSGFVEGINTLDFVVRNEPHDGRNPTGLRVEMTGTAAIIPEPMSALSWGFGMIGVVACGVLKWRRQQRMLHGKS